MTEKYNLKYTNHFSHPINPLKQKEDELIIFGECKITNYDPKKENGIKKGYITITFNSKEQSIKEGCGDKLSQNQSNADFSSKKFSIFSKIEQLDGKKGLSVDDIRKMDKSLIKKWGLQDLYFNPENGVARLVWGENDILRIDFKTSEEIQNKKRSEIKIQAVHAVKEGDSIAKLAQKYGVNTPEIIAVNPQLPADSIIKNKDGTLHVKLKIGQKIKIPVPKVMEIIHFNQISRNEQNFLNGLAERESKNGKNTKSDGNYLGYYQVGEEALISIKVYQKDGTKSKNDWKLEIWPEENEFGIKNKEDFLKSKNKQDTAIIAIMRYNWKVLQDSNDIDINKYIGKTIKGIKITKAGILAGSHLCGTGNLEKFLLSNGTIDKKDGNGVAISTYIREFSCYGNSTPYLTSPLYVYK